MTTPFRKSSLFSLTMLTLSLSLSGCVPVLVAGAGVATVTSAAKEKGISGGLSDTQISVSIKKKVYEKDQDIHRRIGVNVQNGEVLLTGSLPTSELIDDIEQIAWGTPGVKKVINQIGISNDDSFGLTQGTIDSWITTQIKSSLTFTSDIKSINYSIKTVSGIVYVMGVAQSQEELDKVLTTARNTRGVKKVLSYVKIKESPVDVPSGKATSKEDASEEPAAEAE